MSVFYVLGCAIRSKNMDRQRGCKRTGREADVNVFFFFKQKTAYEMRIRDWSSDVCSSDLRGLADGDHARLVGVDRADGLERAAIGAGAGAQRRALAGPFEAGMTADGLHLARFHGSEALEQDR